MGRSTVLLSSWRFSTAHVDKRLMEEAAGCGFDGAMGKAGFGLLNCISFWRFACLRVRRAPVDIVDTGDVAAVVSTSSALQVDTVGVSGKTVKLARHVLPFALCKLSMVVVASLANSIARNASGRRSPRQLTAPEGLDDEHGGATVGAWLP